MDKIKYSTIPRYSLKLVKEKSIRYPLNRVMNSNQAEVVARAYLEDKDCEHLIMLMLDNQNNLIGVHTVAIGGISGLQVAISDMYRHAIAARAHAWICSHNHPSGDVNPSQMDIDLTVRLHETGKLLGIPIVDHLIVSSGLNPGVYSFFQHRLIFNQYDG